MSEGNVSSVDRLSCMGCGSCVASCPKHCVGMRYDNEGFLQPHVDQSVCVACGRCVSACPVHVWPELHEPLKYEVIQLTNPKALHRSASGGAAYGLGVSVIERGGSVVGCVMGESMLPIHVVADNVKTLAPMQGSKYVQSRVDAGVYGEVKALLTSGREILYTGTPCQVAGLYGYLGKKPENLCTLDLVCHGVASPGVFWHYLAGRGKELGGRVVDVRFRCKDVAPYPGNHSLHIEAEVGCPDIDQSQKERHGGVEEHCSLAIDDPFGAAFYHNRILRESCYGCPFARRERVSDITLGDYGEGTVKQFPTADGYSFVSVNTEHGFRLIEGAADLFHAMPIDMSYRQVNLRQPTLRPKARDKMRPIEAVPGRPPVGLEEVLGVTVADRVKRLLPDSLKYVVKRIVGEAKRR